MLTAKQHERLPNVMRAIVDHDRMIAEQRASKTPVFETFKRLRAERREFRRAAEETWGQPIRGDGTART